MYDIILILLLVLIFCNSGNLETFSNDCFIDNNSETTICKEHTEKIELNQEKLELESLRPKLLEGKNNNFTQEYTNEINEINQKINEINQKIKSIELKEKSIPSTSSDSIYGNRNNHIYVNKFINILIIVSISIITFYSLYYFARYILRKLKRNGLEIDGLDLEYDNIMDFLKKQKLKKKYKINT